MEYKQKKLKTKRLTTAYYRAGEENAEKLLLLHGNLSSSVFFLPLFEKLKKDYDVIALDLRSFGDSSALKIDARRGYKDWAEDIEEFVETIGWEKFDLLGWSMGGGIAMEYATENSDKLKSLILVNPSSPYGFGGSVGSAGSVLFPKGLASGAGLVSPFFVDGIKSKDTDFLKFALLETIYFRPGFKLSPEWEEAFIEAISKTKVGDGMFPGNFEPTFNWPFFKAGESGVCNAMSSRYVDLSKIEDISPKPPILWIRGENDKMISNRSICDLGTLVSSSPAFFLSYLLPPQPMISQTRRVLTGYQKKGGYYEEHTIPGAHCPWIESPDDFLETIERFKKTNAGDHYAQY